MHSTVIAIVDCNNFYASCERLFRPELEGKPVVVLSNNDGCVIARSNEAKDLGIKMGDAVFLVEDALKEYGIQAFSSNYALYGDMSARVMGTLASFTTAQEIYSIDECFLDLSGMAYTNLQLYCSKMRSTVLKNTGIPVGIGVATSKTLAKAANKFAKKHAHTGSVFIIDNEEKRKMVLQWLPVGDVWGIGGRNRYYFEDLHGVKTAWDFSRLEEGFIKKKMGIVGLRLWMELNGKACYKIETQPQAKEQIMTSKSFPTDIIKYEEVAAAVNTHVTRCAEKLRQQKTCAAVVGVFIMTNPHKMGVSYSKNLPIALNTPTCSTLELMDYAMYSLRKIFRPGLAYKKCGVYVQEIVPEPQIQTSLFDKRNRERERKLMVTLDKINRKMGRDKVRFAAATVGRNWQMKRARLSHCYTTDIREILSINTSLTSDFPY